MHDVGVVVRTGPVDFMSVSPVFIVQFPTNVYTVSFLFLSSLSPSPISLPFCVAKDRIQASGICTTEL